MLSCGLEGKKVAAVGEVVTSLLLYAILKLVLFYLPQRGYSYEDAALTLADYLEFYGSGWQHLFLDYCDRDVIIHIINSFQDLALSLDKVVSAFEIIAKNAFLAWTLPHEGGNRSVKDHLRV